MVTVINVIIINQLLVTVINVINLREPNVNVKLINTYILSLQNVKKVPVPVLMIQVLIHLPPVLVLCAFHCFLGYLVLILILINKNVCRCFSLALIGVN